MWPQVQTRFEATWTNLDGIFTLLFLQHGFDIWSAFDRIFYDVDKWRFLMISDD